MVDQNSNAPSAPGVDKPHTSQDASNNGLKSPPVVKAGETMLIIALVLILLVCMSVSLHFFLRRRRRRRKEGNRKKKEKKKNTTNGRPDAQTPEKNVVELVGTPICELGDSEPRHEMEDVEVHERHMTAGSEADVDMEAGQSDGEIETSWYDETEDGTVPEPESREFAMYWSRGI